MSMSSQVRIWQSPFMKFFLFQQNIRWYRNHAASIILTNCIAALFVGLERHYQAAIWLFPVLRIYAFAHSSICFAAMLVFAYNVVEFFLRYLICCYQLNCKFVVDTEEERQDLSRSFRCNSLVTVARPNAAHTAGSSPTQQPPRSSTSSPLLHSPPASQSPQQHSQRHSSAAKSPPNSPLQLLQSVYLPSASPHKTSPRGGSGVSSPQQQQQQQQQHQKFALQSSQTPRISPQEQQQLFGSGGGGGGCSGEFGHLSRLCYQQGSPSPRPTGNCRPLTAVSLQQQQQQQQCQAADASGNNSSSNIYGSQQQQQHLLQLKQASAVLPHSASLRALGVDAVPDRWLRGIRAWLHGTIVEPLSRDVDRANARLRSLGIHDMLVGVASLQQMQTPGVHQQIVGQLLPYLAACEDQGYLVRRLADLASAPCLGAFRWDSGGGWSASSSHLSPLAHTAAATAAYHSSSPNCWSPGRHPNDANLLMHLLSAYLDRCLPPLPADAKPFSSVYIARSLAGVATASNHPASNTSTGGAASASNSASAAASAAADLRILQASRQPPHYQLVMSVGPSSSTSCHQQQQQQQHQILDLAPGTRNFFYCVLLFLHHWHARCGSRLGQISLGESGLNVAWIFDGRGVTAGEADIDFM